MQGIELSRKLSIFVQAYLEENSLSERQLAHKIGKLNQGQINRIINRPAVNTSRETLNKVCKGLGCELSDIMDFEAPDWLAPRYKVKTKTKEPIFIVSAWKPFQVNATVVEREIIRTIMAVNRQKKSPSPR